jgi:hypothetical protein
MHRADHETIINDARNYPEILKKGIDVRFVGAWRGGSRTDFGHAIRGYEDESDDESNGSENEE